MKFIFVIFIGLFLTSCVDLAKSEQLARIDSMNQTIDSIDVVFKEHKLDSLAIMSINATAVVNRIKTYYVSDTVNLVLGRKMAAFKVMRRSMDPMGKAIIAIESSISEERASLTELSDDINGSNGERDKYEEFIGFEEAKVNQLKALTEDYVITKTESLLTYETYYDELNDFSMRLKNKQE